MLHRCSLALASAWLSLTAGAQVAVHVVDDDGGPGVSFTDLQAAVTAAADGDVLLVRDGQYGSFTVRGKGLYVLEDSGADARVRGTVTVQGVPAGRTFALRGLDVQIPLGADPVDLSASGGTLHLEDCRVLNGNLGQFGTLGDALRVQGCRSVTLVRCVLTGSPGGGPDGGGEGLVAAASVVNLFDSLSTGGPGAIGDRNAGGHGARLSASTLYASGTSFTGANGGNGITITTQFGSMCRGGGDGGSGIVMTDPQSGVTLLDTRLVFGQGGSAPAGCSPGAPGQPIETNGGTLVLLPWPARSFAMSAPVREGASAELLFLGEPGDLLVVGLSSRGLESVGVPPVWGPLLVDPTALRVLLPGTLPASGGLQVSLPAPAVPALGGLPFHAQALFRDTSGVLLLGPPSLGAVLDSGL